MKFSVQISDFSMDASSWTEAFFTSSLRLKQNLPMYRLKPATLRVCVCVDLACKSQRKRKIPLHNVVNAIRLLPSSIQKRVSLYMYTDMDAHQTESTACIYRLRLRVYAYAFQSERIFCSRWNRTIAFNSWVDCIDQCAPVSRFVFGLKISDRKWIQCNKLFWIFFSWKHDQTKCHHKQCENKW